MKDTATVGSRIAEIRKLRGLTQEQLAQQAHVSRSMLAQVERGHSTASTVWIGSVARALGVDASRLHGSEEAEQILDVLPVLRRTLAATDLMDPDLEPRPLGELLQLTNQVAEWRRDAKYSKITAVLPDLVDQLLVAGEHGQPVYMMLTAAFRAANTVAHKSGFTDLSLTATERMEWAASKSGDPLLLATTHYVKSATLARVGASKQALRLLVRSMSDMEQYVEEDETAAAVYSLLHMRAGTIAAAAGDADTSRSHLAEAGALAARIGDRIVYDSPVGPTNVRLYQLCAEVDLGEPGRAREIAAGTRLGSLPAERRAYFWLDAARAHLMAGDTDAAEEALTESCTASAEHFRSSPTVKNIIRTAAQKQRVAGGSLRALANAAGIQD